MPFPSPHLGERPSPAEPGMLRASERGFTLTEIALAIGIFSFALISLLGLLSVGLKNTRKSSQQTIANQVLASVASDIRSASSSTSGANTTYTSKRLAISAVVDSSNTVSSVTPASLTLNESGSKTTDAGTTNLKEFKVTLSTPSAAGLPAVRVKVQWPATPANATAEGTVESLIPLPIP